MGSQVFFTSDPHFQHHNLRELRNKTHNKSFSHVSEVDQWLINNWNSVVRPKDIIWVLGDVAWSKSGLKLLQLCNGHKKLILGNHDTENNKLTIQDYLPYFESIHGIHKKYGLVMSHVPIHPQELENRWTHNIHGHIHNIAKNIPDPRYINVNTDVRNGTPVHLDDIRKEIKNDNT